MWDEDPLPDGLAVFEIARRLARGTDADVKEVFGSAALLIQSNDVTRPMGLGKTLSGVESEPTSDVRVLLLPLKKQPGRNSFPHISVGRTRNNDVILMDATVSKFHAFLKEDEEGLSVTDSGSRNGTFVDAVPVGGRNDGPPVALTKKASLRFGSVTTVFLPFDELCDLLRRSRGD